MKHPNDVFLSHLFEIDPTHYRFINQNNPNDKTAQTKTNENIVKQFADPRNGIEIPSHFCNYTERDITGSNIFLKNCIEISRLRSDEHSACIKAIHLLNQQIPNVNPANFDYYQDYESTARDRNEEKQLFLGRLREHFMAKISTRYHHVPPAIDNFVMHIWKKQLIDLHRGIGNVGIRLRTALSLQATDINVQMKVIHQDHIGNVTEIYNQNIEFVRQSSANLQKTYNERKSKQLLMDVDGKKQEFVQKYGIDFIMPISILKLILCDGCDDWNFEMSVRDSKTSTVFNPKKEIHFQKPLPSLYLSGNARYKKGAKYLLRSCFSQNSSHILDRSNNMESDIGIVTESAKCNSNENNTEKYQLHHFDRFMEMYFGKKMIKKLSSANVTFTVFEMVGGADENDAETFRILIPSKQDAYKRNQNDEICFINLSAKIEFQSEYGVEELTKDELICEWCDLYFRPDSITERSKF